MAPGIDSFLNGLAQVGDPVLEEMEAEGRRRDFPIVGAVVGGLLEQQARAIGARQVFEMGSGFGYSTAWFARAVGAEGKVVHTDGSQALSDEARRWMARLGHRHVQYEVGDARDVLAASEQTWDLIFIDADKEQYPACWELACDRVRPGGLVIADNALWHGRVADGTVHDDATRGVREYLRRCHADERFLTTVLPLRDGVAISLRT